MNTKIQKTLIAIKERVNKTDLSRRMANGLAWTLCGTVVSKFMIFLVGIVLARIFGQVRFGEYGILRNTINLLMVFGATGMGLTATKYISEFRKTQPERIYSIYRITNMFALAMAAVVSVLVFVFADIIADRCLHAPHLEISVRVLAVVTFITFFNLAQNGTLLGLECFKRIQINTFIGAIVEVITMIIGAYYWGVEGSLVGLGIGCLVITICNHWAIKKEFKIQGVRRDTKISEDDYRLLYHYSLPAVLQSLLVIPVLWFLRWRLIGHVGYAGGGDYEVASQWRTIVLFIPTSIAQIVLPLLSSESAGDDKTRFWKLFKMNLQLNAAISFVMVAIVCVFAPVMLPVYGKAFNDVWVIIFLVMSTFFATISNVLGITISSKGKMWIVFAFNLTWAIMAVLLNEQFLIRQEMGPKSVSLALLFSYAILSCIQATYVWHSHKKDMSLKAETR